MGRVDGSSLRPLSRMRDQDGRVLEERRADVKAALDCRDGCERFPSAGTSCAIREPRGRGRDGMGGLGKLAVATQ